MELGARLRCVKCGARIHRCYLCEKARIKDSDTCEIPYCKTCKDGVDNQQPYPN
jgi:hypothetical protein